MEEFRFPYGYPRSARGMMWSHAVSIKKFGYGFYNVFIPIIRAQKTALVHHKQAVEPGAVQPGYSLHRSGAHVQIAVDTRREEAALRDCSTRQVDDVQDIRVTAAEGESVGIERHDVRAACCCS